MIPDAVTFAKYKVRFLVVGSLFYACMVQRVTIWCRIDRTTQGGLCSDAGTQLYSVRQRPPHCRREQT